MKLNKVISLVAVGTMTASLLAGCGSSSSTSSAASGSSASSAASTASSAADTSSASSTETASSSAADSTSATSASSTSEAVSASGSSAAASSDEGTVTFDLADGDGEGKRIAVLQQHQTNAFQIALSDAAQAEADRLGADITFLSADQDAATQISQFEQCIADSYDAIIFEPVDPAALGDAAQQAADAGITVVNFASACDDWEDHGISAISVGNNVNAGELEMTKVIEKMGKDSGNIAILTGPSGDAGGLQRMEGYENILKDYPNIKQVVEPADCQWDTASAQSTVESWLSAYDLDAIIAENDGMAVGAGNAAGADSGIVIAGVDGTPDGIEAIEDGRITGSVSQDPASIAKNAVDAAITIVNGGTLENTTIYTTCQWIDADNVSDFES